MELFSIFEKWASPPCSACIVSVPAADCAARLLCSPSEQRLAMMRPLSLAGIFAGLERLQPRRINVLRGLWHRGRSTGRIVAVGPRGIDRAAYVAFRA
jgi:hypothetical protein